MTVSTREPNPAGMIASRTQSMTKSNSKLTARSAVEQPILDKLEGFIYSARGPLGDQAVSLRLPDRVDQPVAQYLQV